MSNIFEIFSISFMQKALIISLVTGAFLSYIGVFVILRRIVFVGIAIAQASACGFALGLFAGISPTMSSLILTLFAVWIFSIYQGYNRIPIEGVSGIIYAGTLAFTLIFIAKNASAESHVLNMLSGDILTITWVQVMGVTLSVVAASILHVKFFKKFIFISYDPEAAYAAKLNVKLHNFIFYMILGIAISLSMKTAGVLLSFGYLVIPASIALILKKQLKTVFFTAVVTGLITTFFGLYLSFILDLPSGTTIVAILSILLVIINLIFRNK